MLERSSATGSVVASLVAALSLAAAHAETPPRPLGPALLDAGDSGLRADLAWLVDRGLLPGLTLGTWPMPASTLERAGRAGLGAGQPLASADADALARVRQALDRQRAPVVFGLGLGSERRLQQDAERPVRGRAESGVSLQADAPSWAWRLNARIDSQPIDTRERSELGADGSFAAAELGGVVVALGAVDRWWGPSPASSPILGNAAAPMPALLLRRADETAPQWAPMAWVGPWSWEVSVARPQDYTPRESNAIGLRLAARPLAGLELGASRFIYWGGDGRPNSLSSLWDALRGNSNIDDPNIQGPDPSNEIAGFDVRYAVALPQATLVGWAHWVGEDEAGGMPSHYLGTLGVQLGHTLGAHRLQWSVEGSDTRLDSFFGLRDGIGPGYRNGAFTAGHYHRGLPVGAPIGGGGQHAAAALEWVALADPNALRGQLRLWTAQLNRDGADPVNFAHPVPGSQRGALLRLQGERTEWRWRTDLVWQRDPGDSGNPWGVVFRLDWSPAFGR